MKEVKRQIIQTKESLGASNQPLPSSYVSFRFPPPLLFNFIFSLFVFPHTVSPSFPQWNMLYEV